MGKAEFKGFDEMMAALEICGRLDVKTLQRITKPAAEIVLEAVKDANEAFKKYAKRKATKSGGQTVYYNGTTHTGYRAMGAAIVYADGKNDKKPVERPFFQNAVKATEKYAVEAMQREFDKVLEEAYNGGTGTK